MTYKYYPLSASPPYTSACVTMVNDFQAMMHEQFSIATNYFIIKEEYPFASGSYIDTPVRISGALVTLIGDKNANDFKEVLFDGNHPVEVGRKYQFDNNFWICVNNDNIKSITSSITVRRCNNQLRWMGTDGTYYSEVCAFDEYRVSRPRDSVGTSDPVAIEGYIDLVTQLNSKTRLIKPNQRFLFGNSDHRVCLKIFGNGVRNWINQETLNDDSSTLLLLSMGGAYVNEEVDNTTLGIADYYRSYNTITSASVPSGKFIVTTPSETNILEGTTTTYTTQYYSGSVPTTGSFVFIVSGSSVPVTSYDFVVLGNNSFSITNYNKYLDNTLDIKCSGTSGSTMLNLNLRGVF